VIEMRSILVNATLETLCNSDFANTNWVVTNGGGSASTQFVSILRSCRSGKTRKLVSYAN
jgi:hypothetical protein